MNFGWVGGDDSYVTAKERGVILHEFGHALGMLHEHESPARGGVLTLDVASALTNYFVSIILLISFQRSASTT